MLEEDSLYRRKGMLGFNPTTFHHMALFLEFAHGMGELGSGSHASFPP